MLLNICFLLNCLFNAVSQHVSLPKLDRDPKCRDSDLHLIKDFFKHTTVIRNENNSPSYCVDNQELNNLNFSLDIDQVIDLYKKLDFVNSFKNVNPEGPITQDGFITIDDHNELPLYLIADIRREHLPCSESHPGFTEEVDFQMNLMGKMKADDRGYIMPYALGGSLRPLNVIPIALNVYWRIEQVVYDYLGMPLSHLKANEDWVRKFLFHAYPFGRVAWKTALLYEEKVFVEPKKFRSYRPLRITVQYTAYTDQNDNNSIYYVSPQLTFLNHNNYSCDNASTIRCHDENAYVQLRAELNCDVLTRTKANGTVGRVLNESSWDTKRDLSFPFNIQGRTYFYSHHLSARWQWIIQELLPNGQMGEETDKGFWKVNYNVIFPFFMNGTQFIYGHSSVNKTCMIRDLFASGKMGPLSDEQECKAHSSAFPFTFNGIHYFYSQSNEPNNRWFIQELLPGGKIGKEVRSGILKEIYPLLFRYTINNTQLFFAHNPESKNWFISQLLPDSEMVRELTSKSWQEGYTVGFSYAINGRHFIYLSSSVTSRWFIKELLPNGTFSDLETAAGFETEVYHIAFPFLINGGQYMYKHGNKKWKISELL